MVDTYILDDIVKRLCDAMPDGLQVLREDLEKNFRSILQNAFAKLDLVTREEYDTQVGVLARTREKLTQLEEKVKVLEAQLQDKSP